MIEKEYIMTKDKSMKNIRFKHALHNVKVLGLAGLLATSSLKANAGDKDVFTPKIESVKFKPNKSVSQESLLTKKYQITDRESFDELWNDAKPFCIPVLIASENWRPDWHNDKHSSTAPNSVGIGMYYFPVDRDFSSSKWKTTKSYYSGYKNENNKSPRKLSPREMRDAVYGWGESWNNGSNLNALYKSLKGTELTVNEFAAIFSHTFHTGNSVAAKKIVAIKNNPKIKNKELRCAQVLLDTDPVRYAGQKSRFMHEALVFLNTDGYCYDLFSLCVDCNMGTSINACPRQFYTVCRGKLTDAKAKTIKDKICACTVRNGVQIKELCASINDKNIMAFCVETPNTLRLDERDTLYNDAFYAYTNHDYKTAKKLFNQVVKQNGDGPELWNDMAVTYSNLKEYDKCIELCKKVLTSGVISEYPAAYYNAGFAYEAKHDFDNSLKNYKKALEYYNDSVGDVIDTGVVNMYKNAIARVKKQLNLARKDTTAIKADMFAVASLSIRQRRKKRVYNRTNEM